jgi:hypothetical protein
MEPKPARRRHVVELPEHLGHSAVFRVPALSTAIAVR